MKRTFLFRGREYKYFNHWDGSTRKTERAVEIPIAIAICDQHESGRVLEVGNVLSQYFFFNGPYDVVDKFEKGKGIINCDIEDFQPSYKYDLIISISTLEHVGWDEDPRDPEKATRVIEKLENLLNPGGFFVATIPMGYNAYLDNLFRKGTKLFPEQYYLQRSLRWPNWKEVSLEDILERGHEPLFFLQSSRPYEGPEKEKWDKIELYYRIITSLVIGGYHAE